LRRKSVNRKARVRGKSTPTSRRAAAATRKPRATGLSRERIVTETLKYLRHHPDKQLTMARAGAAVHATSMAIYRHFRDGADLADAILGVVLADLSNEIPTEADWQTQVRAWMRAVYRRLLTTPQCVSMMATVNGPSLSWVRASVPLSKCVARSGRTGPQLAEMMFWIGATVAGFAQQTLGTPLTRQIDGTLAAIASLEPEEVAVLSPFVSEIPRIYSRALDIMIERTLASAEELLEVRSPRRPVEPLRGA
jgi:AcrR family transcriptional regulator